MATAASANSPLVLAGMAEHFAVQCLLHQEARLLDEYRLRTWLDTMVHPDIRYRMVIRPEVLGRDVDGDGVWIYDDALDGLELRVCQFETGLQKMLDPLPRMTRMLTNIEVFEGTEQGVFEVRSYGLSMRFRREYEQEQISFKRTDRLIRDNLGKLKIIERFIELPQRVFVGKNLLIFL